MEEFMTYRILIINAHLEHHALELNKGGEAVMLPTIEVLRRSVPNAEFTTTVQFADTRLAEHLGCEVIPSEMFRFRSFSLRTSLESGVDLLRAMVWRVMKNRLGLNLPALIGTTKLRAYANADAIIHLSLDSYSEDQGTLAVIEHSKDILLAMALNKPVIMWAGSIGPFKSMVTRHLAKFVLNRARLITVREATSRQHLDEAGVRNPHVYVTADPAFLLQVAPPERVEDILRQANIARDGTPLVGLTLPAPQNWGTMKRSRFVAYAKLFYFGLRYVLPEPLFVRLVRIVKCGMSHTPGHEVYRRYLQDMSTIVDWMVEELDVVVVLSSHQEEVTPMTDYAAIAGKISQLTRHKNRVRLIPGQCTAAEFKGVASQYLLHVGGKMHSNIASLSQGVPTVGLAYSYKFRGIMAMLGQEQSICSEGATEALKAKVKEVWHARQEIREELEARLAGVKELALLNGQLVKDVLCDTRTRSQ
jgi:colanic acid/amylovoran biosynthesis protein